MMTDDLDELLDKAVQEYTGTNTSFAHIEYLKPIIQAYIDKEVRKSDGCPCLLVEPCSYACSCANPNMSGGCARCCKYGSKEQRLESAKRLAELKSIKGEQ